MMKTVAILKSNLLPISETFIKEQVLAFNDWNAVLVGETLVKGGLDLTGIETVIYKNSRFNWWNKQLRQFQKNFRLKNTALIKTLEEINPDIIHVHFGQGLVRDWPSLKHLNKPVVATLHGTDINAHKSWWQSGNDGFNARFYPERLVKISKEENVYFIAVSQAIKERAIEYGIPREKITVRYIGVDTEKFQPLGLPIFKRNKNILFVGRLIENKGPLVLLEAFQKISKILPDVKLTILGSGPLLKVAKQITKDNSLNVEFLGSQPHQVVQAKMQEARVLCLPSFTLSTGHSEGMPIVTLEAQASGVPVVTSARGASTEGVLDGETGFKFDEKDVDSLTEKLVLILTDDDLAKKMSEKAPVFIKEKFDIKKCTKSLEKTYEEIRGK